MVSHSVTQKSNPTQTAPAPSGTWAVWMYEDCFGFGFVAQPDSECSAAMRDGFALVDSDLTLEEACKMRDDLKSGELTLEDIAAAHVIPDEAPAAETVYVTRHGYTIFTPEQLQARARPTSSIASEIPGFNWSAIAHDDIPHTEVTSIRRCPVAGKDKWVARAFYWGFFFFLFLDETDIAFIEFQTGITLGDTHEFAQPLLVWVQDASAEIGGSGGARGIRALTTSRIQYRYAADDWYKHMDAILAQASSEALDYLQEGSPLAPDTVTAVTVSDELPVDDYPDWMPPVKTAERPRFVYASGRTGD